jgi:hypothetical protein
MDLLGAVLLVTLQMDLVEVWHNLPLTPWTLRHMVLPMDAVPMVVLWVLVGTPPVTQLTVALLVEVAWVSRWSRTFRRIYCISPSLAGTAVFDLWRDWSQGCGSRLQNALI